MPAVFPVLALEKSCSWSYEQSEIRAAQPAPLKPSKFGEFRELSLWSLQHWTACGMVCTGTWPKSFKVVDSVGFRGFKSRSEDSRQVLWVLWLAWTAVGEATSRRPWLQESLQECSALPNIYSISAVYLQYTITRLFNVWSMSWTILFHTCLW